MAGAKKAFEAGVDGLVVEGTEGGGFKSPEEVGLFVLIQAIKNEIDLPIVAAGGIVDGVGMAAAFAAGAEASKWEQDLFQVKRALFTITLKIQLLDQKQMEL